MADYSRFLGGDVAGGSGMRSAGNPGAAFGGELEAGISGSGVSAAFSSPYSPPYTRRRASYRTMGGSLSPRSAAGGGNDDGGAARFFFDSACGEEPRHFLDACFLCKKPLGSRDIFMYRGDTPFCSEECRQEQIEMDEAKEKNRTLSMKAASSRKEQKQNQDADKASLRIRATGTVVAG